MSLDIVALAPRHKVIVDFLRHMDVMRNPYTGIIVTWFVHALCTCGAEVSTGLCIIQKPNSVFFYGSLNDIPLVLWTVLPGRSAAEVSAFQNPDKLLLVLLV